MTYWHICWTLFPHCPRHSFIELSLVLSLISINYCMIDQTWKRFYETGPWQPTEGTVCVSIYKLTQWQDQKNYYFWSPFFSHPSIFWASTVLSVNYVCFWMYIIVLTVYTQIKVTNILLSLYHNIAILHLCRKKKLSILDLYPSKQSFPTLEQTAKCCLPKTL